MDVLIFPMLFYLTFQHTEAFDGTCPAARCSNGAPDIRFPFRAQGQQPKHCGYPGFELVCRHNQTIVQFPSYGDLVVKSISYDIRKLNLLDPKNCVHEVFLNLNLSLTPFQYYYVVKNYTYLNCSAMLLSSFTPIPCLSGSKHHVYVVESSQDVPIRCRAVKTIAIPFAYSPYLSDDSFGLGLTWDLIESHGFGSKGGLMGFQSKPELIRCFNIALGKVASMTILISMVATLIGVKTCCSKKMQKNQFEVSDLV